MNLCIVLLSFIWHYVLNTLAHNLNHLAISLLTNTIIKIFYSILPLYKMCLLLMFLYMYPHTNIHIFSFQGKLLEVELLCQRLFAFSSVKNVSQITFWYNSSCLHFMPDKNKSICPPKFLWALIIINNLKCSSLMGKTLVYH